jgi:hypothetical protein
MEPITLGDALGWGLTTIGGAFVGSYLGAYMKKKGEDRAMKEGFSEVLQQARETTTATKSIEAKISDDVWDRQKRWEMKREVLFETMKRVAALYDQLNELDVFLQTELNRPEHKGEVYWQQTKIEKNEKWFRSVSELNESRLSVEISCGQELIDALVKYRNRISFVAGTINKGDGEVYRKTLQLIITLRDDIRDAVRKELGINGLSKPQSTGSSTAPFPAGPDLKVGDQQ